MSKKLFVERNDKGRDFVVGDLHGMFSLLTEKLLEVDVDPEKDRLFSVGDLVDRGPESFECLRLIKSPFVHAVKGNHEQMMIDAILHEKNVSHWYANGGAWSREYMDNPEFLKLVAAADDLPTVICVDTANGPVWISHAEPMLDWDLDVTNEVETKMLWSRNILGNKHLQDKLSDARSFHGHSPVQLFNGTGLADPLTIKGATWIDTGAVFEGGELTLMEI